MFLISKPRAATSVATRIDPLAEGDEKRSMERRRAFCAMEEWREIAGTSRFCRNGVSLRTPEMEFVKTNVLCLG